MQSFTEKIKINTSKPREVNLDKPKKYRKPDYTKQRNAKRQEIEN
jgi:hypothetical protein